MLLSAKHTFPSLLVVFNLGMPFTFIFERWLWWWIYDPLYLSLTRCFLPMKYKAGSWKQNPRSLLRNYSWDSRRSQRISNFSLGRIWSSRLSPRLLSPLTPTSTTPWGLSSPAAPFLGIFSPPSGSLTHQKTSRRVQSNHFGRLPHLDGFSWDERLSPWPWFVCSQLPTLYLACFYNL